MPIQNFNSSLSALTAFQRGLDNSSNNIANALSTNFKSTKLEFIEDSNGGVSSIVKLSNPTSTATSSKNELSNTDLGTEIINSVQFKDYYQLSVAAIKTKDQLLGTLVDLKT